MKFCDGMDIYMWSCFIDNMKEHLRYLNEDFTVKETDIFVCTYPRSGTNWTQEIVRMLTQRSAEFAPMFTFIESLPMKQLEESLSPRVICTHLPMRYLPPVILDKAKIVCVFRNPKDVAVSIHNFNSHLNFLEYNASFGEYLQLFLSDGKEIPMGSWFDHVKGWEKVIEENKNAKILTLRYEDMKANLRDTIERLADFLGNEKNPTLFSKITEQCDFKVQYAERTTHVFEIVASMNKNTSNFLFGKGQVGDWKNWFTVAQNEEFDRIYEERMKDSKLKMKFSLD